MLKDYDLKKIRKKFPLKKAADVVLNRDELAEALSTTTVTIDRYRKGGMPVAQEGGNGKSYEFQLGDCYAWLMEYKSGRAAEEKQKREVIDQMRLELHGIDADEDSVALSPKEQAAEYEASKKYAETALIRGRLVRVSEIRMMLEGLFALQREKILSIPDVIERKVGITPEQVEEVDKIARSLLVDMQHAIGQSNLVIDVDLKAVIEKVKKPTRKKAKKVAGVK